VLDDDVESRSQAVEARFATVKHRRVRGHGFMVGDGRREVLNVRDIS
jgi:hypothetical protein